MRQNKEYKNLSQSDRFLEKEFSRDFYRYSCKNRLRLGGLPEFIAKVPDKLFRIDGLYRESLIELKNKNNFI